jgi:hypothetical protein
MKKKIRQMFMKFHEKFHERFNEIRLQQGTHHFPELLSPSAESPMVGAVEKP